MSIQPGGTSLTDSEDALQLQLQAVEIIDKILTGSDPAEEGVRGSLRRHVARWPGQPERALLMHMMTIQPTDR